MSQRLSKNDLLALFDEIKNEELASFPLTESFLKRFFKPAVFNKAKDYLSHDLVLWREATEGFKSINGEVANQEGETFYPQATIKQLNGQPKVTTSCSCRLGQKCEHIAAVFLSLKTEHSGEFGKNYLLHDWFTRLESLKSKSEKHAPNVLLFSLEKNGDDIVLLPKIAPRSENQYGLGRALTAKQLSSQVTPKDLDEKDFRLFSWIRSQNTLGKLTLHGEWGALALAKLVETKRCYWGDERTPLSLIHKEPLAIDWQENDLGAELKLSINTHQNWVLVPTTPPYFVDLETKQVGEIDTSLASDEMSLLLTMPAVEKSSYAQAQDKLNGLYGFGFVPYLVDSDSQSTTPQPCLRFELVDELPTLALSFNYKTAVHNGAFENTCINQLNNYGLELVSSEANTRYFRFPPANENQVQWHWFINEVCDELKSHLWKVSEPTKKLHMPSEAKLVANLSRVANNKLQLDVNFSVDQLVLDFNLLREKAALINNKANKDYYINYHQDRWLVVSRSDALNLKQVIDQYYGEKRWPKRFTLPLSALTLLRVCDSAMFIIEDKQLSELFYLEHSESSLTASLPNGLNATLRDYQLKGLAWLQFLEKHGLGGILADDMGLGKTIQVLSFLLSQKEAKRSTLPSLIICPTSLVNNWLLEAEKFTPDLKLVAVQGANRKKLLAKAATADVVITSFPLLLRDHEHYLQMHFGNIILDEAQTIKNYQSKVSRFAKSLKGDFHLCLSGTPVENNLSELKSLFDFAMPGLLGSTAYFKNHFQQPIERENNAYRAEQLNDIIAGYVLRRTKAEVAKELPAKSEMVKVIELCDSQKSLYQKVSEQIESKVKSIFEAGEQQASKLLFLESLLKLRQICCDPRLISKSTDPDEAINSAKLNYLANTLPEMLKEGRKVIVFSQFTSMLSLIEQKLSEIGIDYSLLTGQTRHRQKAIDKFQQGDVSVFLISLKAGGTGLNLTAADTVIHYDPWWNPAVERQATDRAYRIGQDKPVFVYKLICQNSIEEKVQRMQQEKAALAERFFDSNSHGFSDFSEQDLLQLIGS